MLPDEFANYKQLLASELKEPKILFLVRDTVCTSESWITAGLVYIALQCLSVYIDADIHKSTYLKQNFLLERVILKFLMQAEVVQLSPAWGMQCQVQNGATFKINILILVAISCWSYVAGLLGSHSSPLNFFFCLLPLDTCFCDLL